MAWCQEVDINCLALVLMSRSWGRHVLRRCARAPCSSRVHNFLWNHPRNFPSFLFKHQHWHIRPCGKSTPPQLFSKLLLITPLACCDPNCYQLSLCYSSTINFEIGISLKNTLPWTLRTLDIDHRSHRKHCCWLVYCCSLLTGSPEVFYTSPISSVSLYSLPYYQPFRILSEK